ncbi:MAG: hypothetical protein WCA32_21240 [Chromatiaceae bacterium]
MLRRLGTIPVAFALIIAGCGGSKLAGKNAHPPRPQPITVQSPDLRVTLAKTLRVGDEGTLVKDAGWREYVLEVQNLSGEDLTVKNVRLLNPNRHYIESASTYEQILVPPITTLAVAGDVAKTTAGIAAGQIIPYGGYLVSVLPRRCRRRANRSRLPAPVSRSPVPLRKRTSQPRHINLLPRPRSSQLSRPQYQQYSRFRRPHR